jgi:hypothetical protein
MRPENGIFDNLPIPVLLAEGFAGTASLSEELVQNDTLQGNSISSLSGNLVTERTL